VGLPGEDQGEKPKGGISPVEEDKIIVFIKRDAVNYLTFPYSSNLYKSVLLRFSLSRDDTGTLREFRY